MKYLLISLVIFRAFLLQGNPLDNTLELDPYQWLEQENSTQTLLWLVEQESRSENYFQTTGNREVIQNRLKKIINFDFVDIPQKHGANYYFFCRKKEQKQSSLYVMKDHEEPNMLINPSMLNEEGTVALTDFLISPNGSLVAYGLSKSGSDWQEWRIRDLETGEDLPDRLQGIKFTNPAWDKNGKGLYYFSYKNNDLENSFTEQSKLFYHQLGDFYDQQLEFSNQDNDNWFYYSLSANRENGQLLFSFTKGSNYHNGIMYKKLHDEQSDFVELLPFGKARYDYFGSYEGRLFFVTNDSAPRGRIISIDPQNPETSQWFEHVSEEEGIIEQACFAGRKLVVGYLKDVSSQIKIYDLNGRLDHVLSHPDFCTTTSGWRNWHLSGTTEDPEFFYPYSDFTTPFTIYHCNADTYISEIFTAPQISWDPEDYEVKQIYYPSKDGTLIPMFIVHRRDLKLDGNQPTLLFGYGGFGIPMTPAFNAKNIAWMDMGGIYASASIRGGGEFGEEWHRAGMLKNKQTVFDDFIAAAEWLCTNGYSNPSKLAVSGRSNGGLLVGACLVQKPDLFKAAVIGVGVLDMLRFHRFTVGWAWTVEYGSPDNPEDFPILHAYSPYHQVKKDAIYPATLITTGDHDNRVVPCHSYKFAAALQAVHDTPNPILLRVYKKTGHNFGKTIDQKIIEDVDLLSFLVQELKMETFDGNDF